MNDQPITITGIAQNGKAGALVTIKGGEVYYIEGLSVWPADINNKLITVIGNAKVENISEEDLKNERGEWKPGVPGKVNVIQYAKWMLTKSNDK